MSYFDIEVLFISKQYIFRFEITVYDPNLLQKRQRLQYLYGYVPQEFLLEPLEAIGSHVFIQIDIQ